MSSPFFLCIACCLSLVGAALPMRPPEAPVPRAVSNGGTTSLSAFGAMGVGEHSIERQIGVSITLPVGRTPMPSLRRTGALPPHDAIAARLVEAALHHAGLGGGLAAIDSTVARARLSGLLPELRLRVLSSDEGRLLATQSADAALIPASQNQNDKRLWLEARATFRLDRLVYSDDEPTLLRIRADAVEARTRIASHVLSLYFQYRHAVRESNAALPNSSDAEDALGRAEEAAAALDIATGGAFHETPVPE